MIEVKNLTKRYGRVTAINDVSFSVNAGEIVGLLGPNGAGKSTTLRVLACYLPATGGDVKVGGADIFSDSFEVRRKIGYLPESVPLYNDMRVNEYLRFRGGLKGLRGRRLRDRMDVVLERCQLTEHRCSMIGTLSKGFRQRVGLADCLIHEPECLILDEPTIGLDPNQIRNIRELIRELSDQYTVLISTHILSEVEMLCERVLIMNEGRIVASDSPSALVSMMKGNERVFVEVDGAEQVVKKALMDIAGVKSVAVVNSDGNWVRLECQCVREPYVRSKIFSEVSRRGWKMRELAVEHRRLEDVFVSLTHGDNGEETDA
jgi:ABC-2 type transport system ATP-binding protein